MDKTTNIKSPPPGEGIGAILSSGVRNYAMYLALVVILIVFNITTKGNFLSPRNISDLINQTAYVAVLAIGMTLILIIKHIDLSVGYVAGFLGAVAATFMANGLPDLLVIPLVLVIGALIGLYQGLLVAKVRVPAFVTTLAGMFIFRGLLSRVTSKSGTIIINDGIFKSMANGFLPDFPRQLAEGQTKLHIITLIVGIIAVILVIFLRIRNRRDMEKYLVKVSHPIVFVIGTVAISAIILRIAWMLAKYKGLPVATIIVGVVLLIYNFMLNKTRLGRYIYGIGGNTEAAALSGINVTQITIFVFISMSTLAALSGMLYSSRLASATPQAGVGFEMEAIASSYIGGVSVNGGVGKVTNTMIGALIMTSLTNGMNLMGTDIAYQYIVKGIIFIVAVAFDVLTSKKSN